LAAFTLDPFDICLLGQKDSLIMVILLAILHSADDMGGMVSGVSKHCCASGMVWNNDSEL
jgi:hypothetical protein